MIQNNIATSAEKVLLKYLAPDAAKAAAQEVAASSATGLTHEIAHALSGLLGGGGEPAPKKPTGGGGGGKPKVATKAPAPTPAKTKPKAKAKAATPAAGGARNLSDEARKIMSFKKALFHAHRRAKLKPPAPEAWDPIVLEYAAKGKICSVDWAKKTALAAQRREANGEKAAAAPKPAKKPSTPAKAAPAKADAPKKVANGTSLAEAAPL